MILFRTILAAGVTIVMLIVAIMILLQMILFLFHIMLEFIATSTIIRPTTTESDAAAIAGCSRNPFGTS